MWTLPCDSLSAVRPHSIIFGNLLCYQAVNYLACNLPFFCAAGTLRDELVGEEYLADYLLYTLNRLQHFGYVDRYSLSGPMDHIQPLLEHIAQRRGFLGQGPITISCLNGFSENHHVPRGKMKSN